MNYYISDLHLFHKNVTGEGSNFDNRPFATLEEMHRTIKENWNNTVTNADNIYILGDLAWENNEEAIALVSTLRGNKHLILGNHCKVTDQRYRQLFTEIAPYKEVSDNFNGINRNVVLCHYPILFWNGQHKSWIHLYGHVHNSNEETIYQKCLKEVNEYFAAQRAKGYMDCPVARAYNVGAMLSYMNYTPRTLEEIISSSEPTFSKSET